MRKRFIAAGLVLTCLLIIAAWNINSIVERNKEYLLGQLARALGHGITADKIEISYQPLALRMANLAIAGDPGDSANPLVLAKDMQVKLRFLPLFLGRLQPAKITLDSPVITIVRDADGRYNYEPQGGERKPPANRTNRSDQRANDRQIFAIAAVQITNGTLRYRDLKNDSEIVLSQIDLRQSDFDEDEPVELQTDRGGDDRQTQSQVQHPRRPDCGNPRLSQLSHRGGSERRTPRFRQSEPRPAAVQKSNAETSAL